MGYDGKVEVGGPAQTRDLGTARLTKFAVSTMNNNVYLLECAETGDILLVDAAADWPVIAQHLGDGVGRVRTILTTHRHHDHVRALRAAVDATGATHVAGRSDSTALPAPVDRAVGDGDEVRVGAVRCLVRELRGHTPGGIALIVPDAEGRSHVLSGDSLFPGGVGRTGSPEDFARLLDDVTTRLFDVLPDDTWVYPGHGADTTLGAERGQLPEWAARGW